MAIDPAHGAGEIGQPIFVVGAVFGTFDIVVAPIDALNVAGVLVFGHNRVVEIDLDDHGSREVVGLSERPADHEGAERLAHILRGPGIDAPTVGHVGDVGGQQQTAAEARRVFARASQTSSASAIVRRCRRCGCVSVRSRWSTHADNWSELCKKYG